MKYRFRLAYVVAWLAISAVAVATSQPNIVWLTCEDLSPRLGCYGDQTVPTPNIDRLAEEGIRYTRAFTATGVCAPCRFTIITGLYPMQAGAQHMRNGSRSSAINEIADPALRRLAKQRPLYEAVPQAGVRCFTEYLREAGYYCSNNSKTDYQFKPPVTAWDDSSNEAHYRNRAEGQPFFAVFNNTVTHESGIHGKGRSPKRTDPESVRVPSFLPDTPIVRTDIARHYDNVIALDRWVGKKLEELRSEGLLENTIVFFFSDHGDGLPRHKRWVFDSGTHVPMLVRFPEGRDAGTTDQKLMSFIDLAPTALTLAGIEPPSYMLGRCFTGSKQEAAPDYVFMHRDRMDDTSFNTIRSARGERYRYVRNYRPELPYFQSQAYRDRAATMGEIYRLLEAGDLNAAQWQWAAKKKLKEELYDTQTDPDEVLNLADDPKYADTLRRMRAALDRWIESTDDPLAMDEVELIKTRVWPPRGKQPVTSPPRMIAKETAEGGHRVKIKCETPGASIGYRTVHSGPWTLYQEPFKTNADELEVVAHRIGWKPNTRQFEIASKKK